MNPFEVLLVYKKYISHGNATSRPFLSMVIICTRFNDYCAQPNYMQPDENTPGGINDSVISGDVHHHHYQPNITPEPQNVQPQSVMIDPNAGHSQIQQQTVMIDPNTGLPQNVIFIQQPSAGPKVVGILIIVFGVITIIGEAFSIGDTIALGGLFIVLSVANVGISGGLIAGGAMMTNYQKRGVHLSLLMIVISTIIGVVSLTMMPGMLDDLAEEEGLSDQEREELDQVSGAVVGFGAIFLVLCNGICGLIIAIPLMITNNGLDDSSLLG